MPLTFEQAQQFVASTHNTAAVGFTLIRTQGDGRVGHMEGTMYLPVAPGDTQMNGRSTESFSDRVRQITISGANYRQPFDYGGIGANMDSTFITFRRLGPSRYEIEITFERWGVPPETITMFNYARTMVYTGAGSPIGQSPVFAIYVLSLNNIQQAIF